MEAAWQIMQCREPNDFIIATGEAHSVKEWVQEAFSAVGLKADDYLVSDSSLFRPSNTSTLIGDISKARKVFGFEPKIDFYKLVRLMVDADLETERMRSHK